MRWQLASTFAAMAMSGCYEEATVACPNGVLCPADQACTGNTPSDDPSVKLCALEADVKACAEADERANCDGAAGPGLCISQVCEPCSPELYECRYSVWTQIPSSASHLAAVSMEAKNEGFAVGNYGVVVGYNGRAWSELPDVAMAPALVGVWSAMGVVFAIDNDGVAYRDGVAMPISGTAPRPPGLNVKDMWGQAVDDLVAVGSEGAYGEYKGTDWRWGSVGGLESLQAVFGVGDSVIAVGKNKIVHRPSRDATWLTIPSPNATDVLLDVWGTSASDFYVVGNGANVTVGILHHFKDGIWSSPALPATLPRLEAIWGSGPNDIHAVGLDGTFLHFDGSSWQLMRPTSSSAPQINDVNGTETAMTAVANDGSIWRLYPPPP